MRQNTDRNTAIVAVSAATASLLMYSLIRDGVVTNALAKNPNSEISQLFQYEGGQTFMASAGLLTGGIANFILNCFTKEDERLTLCEAALVSAIGVGVFFYAESSYDKALSWVEYVLSGGRAEGATEQLSV